jgi:hypothetical protein
LTRSNAFIRAVVSGGVATREERRTLHVWILLDGGDLSAEIVTAFQLVISLR